MLQLQLLDVNGAELNIGDLVKIKCGRSHSNTTFFCKVQLINGFLVPHDTFAWNSLEKVDKLPESAKLRKHDACKPGEDYDYWFFDESNEDWKDSDMHAHYAIHLDLIHNPRSFLVKEIQP